MAEYSAIRSKHATLSGTTADQVTLTGGWSYAEVVNRAEAGFGAAALTFVVANGATPETPTALVDDAEVVLPGERLRVELDPGAGWARFKLVGNGNAYSVVGVSAP